jgi:PhnB protein
MLVIYTCAAAVAAAPTTMSPDRVDSQPGSGAARAAPEGWHSVTPRIVVHGARDLVEFLRRVFDAEGDYRSDRPSEIRIGDSLLMITDSGDRHPMPAFLYVYVPDADATHGRAVSEGARTVEEPTDTPYGDRRAMVEDRWGNTWQIATPLQPEKPPRRAEFRGLE